MQCHLVSLALVVCAAAVSQGIAPVFLNDAADRVEAGFKRTTRKGVTKVDTSKIEVVFQPFYMVEDKDDLDKKNMNLEVKVGDGDWIRQDSSPSKRRVGKYRWQIDNDIPCKTHSFKFVFLSLDGEEAEFIYPTPIEPASLEEITDSGFEPHAPTNLRVEINNDEILAAWDPVECATSYEVKYKKFNEEEDKFITKDIEENNLLLEEGVDSCSDYELIVTAVIGDSFSEEESTDFSTPPGINAAQKLNPSVAPSIDSVKVNWEAWDKLSCVDSYSVTMCNDEDACEEAVTVALDDATPTIEYTPVTKLNQCSSYTIKLKPIYPEQELSEISIPFKTLSPAVHDLSSAFGPVIALAGEEQMTNVSWSEVPCASSYEIYQHVKTEEGDWEHIGSSETTSFTKKGVPCTLLRYGVKFTVDNQQSELIEAEDPVITPMPAHDPYSPPNLIITPSPNGVEISWDHAQCITNYKLTTCSADKEPIECHDEEFGIENPYQHNVSKNIDNLESCSQYTLQVFASSDITNYDAETSKFSTTAPAPSPPENLNVNLDMETGEANITFDPVECASSYKIYKKLDDSESEFLSETNAQEAVVTIPEPCVKFSYGVTSVVDGQESEPSEFLENITPPKNGDTIQPEIVIEEAANSTAVFLIKLPGLNQKCQVETYHLKYQNLGVTEEEEKTVNHEDTENGRIILDEFPGAGDNGMKIQGRVKYAGFELWSPWVSTADPVPVPDKAQDKQASSSLLVPIIIGILVAVVVLALIVFFLVKRRNTQNKYDNENLTDAEESKKLKDNPIA